MIRTGTQDGKESQQASLQIGENEARERVAQSETERSRTEAVLIKLRNFLWKQPQVFICIEMRAANS